MGFEIQERPRKSDFIRFFDKTPPGIVCPHFHILAHANGCVYECAYCYLQLTFRGQVRQVVFNNRADLLREVRQFLLRKEPAVLNAGELADALAVDLHTNLTRDLIPLFGAQDRHLLVLLTKSANVDQLAGLAHGGRTVVSFSVNAQEVAARYEVGSPSPYERIAAGARALAAGYRVRFRIDPIIPVDGWREKYAALVERILAVAPPERITIGSLRFFPNVRSYAAKLGRDATVFAYATEMCREDGRRRVPFAERVEIYRHIAGLLPPGLPVGLCKETETCTRAVGLPDGVCNCTL
jgi:spore photoproduct lyase